MRSILGLTGLRGSGKDTVAKMLLANGWKRLSFGDAIYIEVSEAYGVSIDFLQNRDTKELPLERMALKYCTNLEFVDVFLADAGYKKSLRRALNEDKVLARPGMRRRLKKALSKPLSPRKVLQIWGTEYRRVVYRDDYWREQVRLAIVAEPNTNFVITDVRYPDEGEMLRNMGASIARVSRPGLGGADDPGLQHQSETMMLNYPVDTTFINEEGAQGLAKLEAVVHNTLLPTLAKAA
ncbi:GntR family transcriptional regulator [Novimethylophilus kurashikiensis]|uniref:GntR family transcriptional regulator n=1 Tax=Novimethylophilus kurashikiensis TaxID=1825523 RepID=A0A2R5F894_9PROT|nr:hypothetical protein [Novimethylophilus kurashikiensis]GBG14255.1 GntR family transcriptional regulator [Novimethylophilus kurashikiensis]